jgi:hypothetical protein
MDDESNPLHDLMPTQLVERALDLRHEVSYWQTVLGDTGTISDELAAITEQLLSSTVSASTLLALGDDRSRVIAGQLLEANGEAMTKVLGCMRLVHGLIDLANGRGLALDKTIEAINVAAGIEPDDDGESAES